MKPCSQCQRPLLAVARSCPFCGVRLTANFLKVAAGAVVAPFVLSACYGMPPCQTVDRDEDGFRTCEDGWGGGWNADCDDSNADINPGEEEVCDDGLDNNCDGILGSTEQPEVCGNGLDDDCDGAVDELATEPGVEVECGDGLDDDCDGLVDFDDPDCDVEIDTEVDTDNAVDTDTDTELGTSGDLVVDYTFDGPPAAVDCATAGLSTLTVHTTGPEPTSAFSTVCDDAGVALNALANGMWVVELSGSSTSGEQWRGSIEDVVVSGEGGSASVVLGCLGADGVSPCAGGGTESP